PLKKFGYTTNGTKCGSREDGTRKLFFFFYSLTPYLMVLVCYFLIMIQVYRSGKPFECTGTRHTRKRVALRNSSKIKMFSLIIFIFILFVSPMCIFNICDIYIDDLKTEPSVGISIYCFYWFQYALN
ncbi:unnamed protein product, partial [Meganyctiphanes norvegica]